MAKSHVVVGLASWVAAAPLLHLPITNPLYLGLAVAGSLLPDIDHPQSWVGRRSRPSQPPSPKSSAIAGSRIPRSRSWGWSPCCCMKSTGKACLRADRRLRSLIWRRTCSPRPACASPGRSSKAGGSRSAVRARRWNRHRLRLRRHRCVARFSRLIGFKEGSTSFCEKKKQKTLLFWGCMGRVRAPGTAAKSFCASFVHKKRSALPFFLPTLSLPVHAALRFSETPSSPRPCLPSRRAR